MASEQDAGAARRGARGRRSRALTLAGGRARWSRRRWLRRGSSSRRRCGTPGRPGRRRADGVVVAVEPQRRTRCTLPLVPPLCQSSRRLRLQKWASPVASVALMRLGAGVGHHEDLTAGRVLDHAGHQAVGVVADEVEEAGVDGPPPASAAASARHSFMIATPALVPTLTAPALIMSSTSRSVRMPPDALTPMCSSRQSRSSSTSCTVAPGARGPWTSSRNRRRPARRSCRRAASACCPGSRSR